jgi:hypothetical protein
MAINAHPAWQRLVSHYGSLERHSDSSTPGDWRVNGALH